MKSSSRSSGRPSTGIRLALAAAFLLAAAVLNICFGASGLSLSRLWEALISGPGESAAARILWYARLPRTAATLLAGAGLAVSGAVIQKVLSNALASPGIIGVNAGAGLGVVLCTACGAYAGWTVTGASFLGAMAATFAVVFASRKSGASRTMVILGGIAVSTCLNALTQAIVTILPDAALASADFRVGGFSSVDQGRLLPAGILIVLGVVLACTMANELDVLSLGDDTAHALGVRVGTVRTVFLALAALLAGAAVSFAGILGFVGLIVPHISRRLIRTDSTVLLPFTAMAGAGFTAVCDLAARLIFAPYELPTGILLSFLGGPFFIWLLIKRKGKKAP